MAKKVLVSGNLGFIGSHLCKQLMERGYAVSGIDLCVRPPDVRTVICRRGEMPDRMTYINDIRGWNMMRYIFRQVEPDIVIHLAAVSSAAYADKHPRETVQTNVEGTLNLLEAARLVGVKRFVFTSSSMVYGDFDTEPADEGHPLRPRNIYGISKMAGEWIVRRSGLPFTIVRPSAVYGPLDSGGRILERLVKAAKWGRPSEVWQLWRRQDFTYIEDAVQGILLATFLPIAESETFNITSGQGHSVSELIGIIKTLAPGWQVEEVANETWREPRRGALDISHARSLLGYEPRYSLETGLKKYWENFA